MARLPSYSDLSGAKRRKLRATSAVRQSAFSGCSPPLLPDFERLVYRQILRWTEPRSRAACVRHTKITIIALIKTRHSHACFCRRFDWTRPGGGAPDAVFTPQWSRRLPPVEAESLACGASRRRELSSSCDGELSMWKAKQTCMIVAVVITWSALIPGCTWLSDLMTVYCYYTQEVYSRVCSTKHCVTQSKDLAYKDGESAGCKRKQICLIPKTVSVDRLAYYFAFAREPESQ